MPETKILKGQNEPLEFLDEPNTEVSEPIETRNQDVTKDATKDVTKNVTKEIEILALLREDASMTTAEMSRRLSVNRRIIQRELEKLKNLNYIEKMDM